MEPQAIESRTDGLAAVVHDVSAVLQEEGNVRAVFGNPIKLDTRTIIPVATVSMGGGGGGGTALGAAVDVVRRWLTKTVRVAPPRIVGGMGGGLDVRPVGFLSEEDGRVLFTRIDDGKSHSGKPGT